MTNKQSKTPEEMLDYYTLLAIHSEFSCENKWEEKDEFIRKLNDDLAMFCGGIPIVLPVIGLCYQFDEQNTYTYMMKCPPFGYIIAENMSFHNAYDWLMFCVKECYMKRNESEDLQMLFIQITNQLTDFMDGISRNTIIETYFRVVEFMYVYNKITGK